ASILGWVGVLRQGKLPPERVGEVLETIERSGRVQAKLIDDLLDLSRMVAGRLRLEFQPVALAEIIEHALETVRPMAHETRVRMEVVLAPVSGVGAGDAVRLQQIVGNVLTNAVRYTPAGGRVELRLEAVGAQVQIVVRDTGKGIAPEFLPRVFEPFRQAADDA